MVSDEQRVIFESEWNSFLGFPNEHVVFKRSSDDPVIWKVTRVVNSPENCRWDKKGKRPYFVQLHNDDPKRLKRKKPEYIWACGSDLCLVGDPT